MGQVNNTEDRNTKILFHLLNGWEFAFALLLSVQCNNHAFRVGTTGFNNIFCFSDRCSCGTAGTAIREAKDIIEASGANTKGVVVALDRQEKGESELSAIQEVEQNFGISVLSIINLSHIVDYLKANNNADIVSRVEIYRSQYGV